MAAKKPEAEAEAPKKKGKLLIIVSALVVVLSAGGGGAWFFLRSKDAEAHVEEKPKPALFLPLEMFTVNLQPANEGTPEFIQTQLTLKVDEQATIDQIKERMPLVRDRVLMVISGKKSAELVPVAGKRKLAEEIAAAVQTVIDPVKPAAPKKAKKAEAEDEEAKADEEGKDKEAKGDEDGEEAKPKKKAKAVKVAKAPSIEVLFTSFMIQ